MKLYKDRFLFWTSITAVVVSFVLYFLTKAPTTSFWDCGEFIASSYIMGVPHPPGYPTFILLGRFFSILPIAGDIAVRINLLSVLGAVASVFMAFWLIVRIALGNKSEVPENWRKIAIGVGALAGAIIMGFSATFWANAVESEVYTVSMFLALLIHYMALLWAEKINTPGNDRKLLLISFVLWFSVGIHLTTFLVMIPILVYLAYKDYKHANFSRWPVWLGMGVFLLFAIPVQSPLLKLVGIDISLYNLESFIIIFGALLIVYTLLSFIKIINRTGDHQIWTLSAMVMLFAVIGFSTQLIIPIRAAQKPIINENDPSNYKQFKYSLERKQYGNESMIPRMFKRRGSWNNQLVDHPRFGLWRYFSKQYSSPEQSISLSASDNSEGNNRFSLAMLYIVIIGFWGIYESIRRAPPEGAVILIMALMGTIGMAVYMNFSDGEFNRLIASQAEVRNRDYFFTPGFMYYGIIIGLGLTLALDAIASKIKSVGKSRYMKSVFAIALFTGALLAANTVMSNYKDNDRSGNYIPWHYANNILQSCEQNAILFTNGDNDTFPLWFIQQVDSVRTDVRVVNLSLLNTDWYIKQIKHQMGVPITMSDQVIGQLRPIRYADLDRLWRIQDQMIRHIVDNVQNEGWKIPVYFAITVPADNRLGLEDHLVMNGMAYRIDPEKGTNRVGRDTGYRIFSNAGDYGGLTDPSVTKAENDLRLVNNYIISMYRLAESYLKAGSPDSALIITDLAMELQEFDPRWQTKAYMMRIYARCEQLDRIKVEASGHPEGEKIYVSAAQELIDRGKFDQAKQLLQMAIRDFPGSYGVLNNLSILYYSDNEIQKADSLIDKFIANNSDDPDLKKSINQLRNRLREIPLLKVKK